MDNKIAVVTAASKGMGLACVRRLAEEGYLLAVMSRGEDIHGIGQKYGALSLQGSTDNPEDLERLVNAAIEKYGRLDALVNNTGRAAKGTLDELMDAQWQDGMNLLLLNAIRMSRIVTPIFRKAGRGSIVNISTFGAKEPSLRFPISSVFRAALSSFTKLYAEENAAHGIRMNSVLPGYIDSYPATEETIAQIPISRQGRVDEVADVVSYLLSDRASYITGQNILVDGGLTRSI